MTFVQEDYVVDESDGTVNVTILRTGDVSCQSSVVCYTRQQTARVMMDFDERILGNASRVTFLPGEKVSCVRCIPPDLKNVLSASLNKIFPSLPPNKIP